MYIEVNTVFGFPVCIRVSLIISEDFCGHFYTVNSDFGIIVAARYLSSNGGVLSVITRGASAVIPDITEATISTFAS